MKNKESPEGSVSAGMSVRHADGGCTSLKTPGRRSDSQPAANLSAKSLQKLKQGLQAWPATHRSVQTSPAEQ